MLIGVGPTAGETGVRTNTPPAPARNTSMAPLASHCWPAAQSLTVEHVAHGGLSQVPFWGLPVLSQNPLVPGRATARSSRPSRFQSPTASANAPAPVA